jgi:hypothetical protein
VVSGARWGAAVVGLLLGAALVVGCGKPAFTLAVRDRYSLGPADIQHLQFFTSGEIVLRREIASQERAQAGNELVVRDGLTVEEVVIPMRTAGVALRAEGDYLLISFARQRPDHALWFEAKRHGEEIMPLEERRYELVHLENGPNEPGPFVPRYSKGYQLTYGGHQYQIADKRMWDVHLLYDEYSADRKRVREEPPGWKISDGVPPEQPPSPPAPPPAPMPAPPSASAPLPAPPPGAR